MGVMVSGLGFHVVPQTSNYDRPWAPAAPLEHFVTIFTSLFSPTLMGLVKLANRQTGKPANRKRPTFTRVALSCIY
jgi:hypothetical protein